MDARSLETAPRNVVLEVFGSYEGAKSDAEEAERAIVAAADIHQDG
jgi:hypothetical protein